MTAMENEDCPRYGLRLWHNEEKGMLSDSTLCLYTWQPEHFTPARSNCILYEQYFLSTAYGGLSNLYFRVTHRTHTN